MKFNISVKVNEYTEQERLLVRADGYLPYSGAFWGAYSYCCGLQVNNGLEFTAMDNIMHYNLQVGKFNSLGEGIECMFGRNHNYKSISTGAVELLLNSRDVPKGNDLIRFNQKGSIVIQNDVWLGDNVSLMPGIIIRNGAVIAKNSHVVSDVPPFAIVGGNPARVIGYRFQKEQIDMLQTISWWDWDVQRIVDNASYFTEDISKFCDAFYDGAKQELDKYMCGREDLYDTYFAFVDYYDNYCSFPFILKSFLDQYGNADYKKLIFFVQDWPGTEIDPKAYDGLIEITKKINNNPEIKCMVDVCRGTLETARDSFLQCSHYIISRTYDTVYFSCLADKLGIDIISGTDSVIQFEGR